MSGRSWPASPARPTRTTPTFTTTNKTSSRRSSAATAAGSFSSPTPTARSRDSPGGHGGIPAKYQQIKIIQPELYDLASDLGETTDVASRHPDVVKRLLAVAERARAELGDSLTKRQGRGVRPAGQIADAKAPR